MVKERLEELSETRVQVLQVFQTDRNRQQTDMLADVLIGRCADTQTSSVITDGNRHADRQTY